MLHRSAISIFILVLLGCFAGGTVAAAEAVRPELSPDERYYALKKIRDAQKDITSMTAQILQEKRLAALKKTLVTEGTITLSKPALLRWDVMKPERTVTVLDTETMTVYRPRTKEAQVYPLSEHMIARNSAAFFATAMSGDFDELERKFNVRVTRAGRDIVFDLEPVGIAVRYITSVSITYDGTTGLPRAFELITPKGDRIKTSLSRVRTNPDIASDTFKVNLPSDVRITNRTESRTTN